jgi:dipeptidyl aminopeptidase/acylaminoacyl peptidase
VEGWSEIYVIAADGGMPRRVTNSTAFSNTRPSWSHNGRWIYFTSDRSGRIEIWKLPVGGGQAVQVTRSGGAAALESPDGKYIYYVKEPSPPGLFRMPAEGGEETQVLPNSAEVFWCNFGVTTKGVYFIHDAKTIRFLDTATGKISTLANLDKLNVSICVSPDDTYVVSAQRDRKTMDLMLVENFR